MILLSFDIEEFDMPFEYGKQLPFEEQISISEEGTNTILNLLKAHDLKATFFSTVTFAKRVPGIISRIRAEGHELASHGVYHSSFKPAHLAESKVALEELSGVAITGFRMPRMMPVNNSILEAAGYTYNSSINPTWLPGRYNNLDVSRTAFRTGNIMQLPASVTPLLRIPLFWLAFHNLPLAVYKIFLKRTYRKDGYVNIYFHPWEFTDLKDKEKFGMPGYVSRNSGKDMIGRMDNLMKWINKNGFPSSTISAFLQQEKA